MPKMKTKKSAAKRLRMTKSGKLKAKAANLRHILTSKSNKAKRQSRQHVYLSDADHKRIARCLPYGL